MQTKNKVCIFRDIIAAVGTLKVSSSSTCQEKDRTWSISGESYQELHRYSTFSAAVNCFSHVRGRKGL